MISVNENGTFLLLAGNRVISNNLNTINDAIKAARRLEWIVGKDEPFQIVKVVADAKKV